MENHYKLIEPFQKKIDEIKESLHQKQSFDSGKEKIIYGTYEKSFEDFSTKALRKSGSRVNEIDYYNNSIKELEQIEEAVLMLEKRIHSDKKNSIQFHKIFNLIHSTKQFAKELIENFNNREIRNNTIAKPRNIKTKLTYKWLIEENKLYEFKRLLIKNVLIDSQIEFQDFKNIFSEKSITEIKNRIVWCNDNASQLIYLINALKEEGILEKKSQNFDYIQLYQCFEKSNGEKFKEKAKSLKNNIDIKISSDYKTLIASIIAELSK